MNIFLPRFLKAAYRQEPISSFILIIGAVDAVIGGVGGRWTLLSLGITTILLAFILRATQWQKAQTPGKPQPPRRLLPPSPSESPLPLLTRDQQRR